MKLVDMALASMRLRYAEKKQKQQVTAQQANSAWIRVEARIYGIIAKTFPDDPRDSNVRVVVKAYFSNLKDSAHVEIRTRSAHYHAKLRRIIMKSKVLHQNGVKFSVRSFDQASLVGNPDYSRLGGKRGVFPGKQAALHKPSDEKAGATTSIHSIV